jgi:hypothetical protein
MASSHGEELPRAKHTALTYANGCAILPLGLGTPARRRETVRPPVPSQLNGRVLDKNAVSR